MILSYDMILENFVRTDREHTENRQRIQNLRPLLSPRIVGGSGPIIKLTLCLKYYLKLKDNCYTYTLFLFSVCRYKLAVTYNLYILEMEVRHYHLPGNLKI